MTNLKLHPHSLCRGRSPSGSYIFKNASVLYIGCTPLSQDDINVLVVVGPSTHPSGSHEVEAGGHQPEVPHPNGWEAMVLHNEPCTNNYFCPDDNRLLRGAFAVPTSMLPPNQPKEEIIAWGIERPDTDRGIGITLPHFYKNWRVDLLRTLIFNSIL